MTELIISFVAGALTVLAPCVLPLLPIILGGSAHSKGKLKPILILIGLSTSILIFTLILKVFTIFIDIPTYFWSFLSGTVLILFGFFSLFPEVWDSISLKFNLSSKSDNVLEKTAKTEKWYSPFLMGAALGPVFSSCSPTFLVIVSTIIKQNFFWGFINILFYLLGLSLVLLPIAFLGQVVVKKLKWAADPNGIFKKGMGLLFILIGVGILFGFDKQLETFLTENTFLGYFSIELEEWFKNLLNAK